MIVASELERTAVLRQCFECITNGGGASTALFMLENALGLMSSDQLRAFHAACFDAEHRTGTADPATGPADWEHAG